MRTSRIVSRVPGGRSDFILVEITEGFKEEVTSEGGLLNENNFSE